MNVICTQAKCSTDLNELHRDLAATLSLMSLQNTSNMDLTFQMKVFLLQTNLFTVSFFKLAFEGFQGYSDLGGRFEDYS